MGRPTYVSGFVALAFALQGCNNTGFTVAPLIGQAEIPGVPTVCDPFGGGGNTSHTNGIESKLTYLPSTSSIITAGNLSTASFDPGAPDVVTSPVRLILSQLAVSTRPFTEGFAAQDSGTKLTDLAGNVLDEYFSVRGSANIQLTTGDTEGDYELALLSDDGSTLDLDVAGNGNYSRWIDNDGTHGNDFICAPQTLHLANGLAVPMRMNYYQGPRVRIALMLLWRLKNASSPEPECGHYRADDYFFVPSGTNPSVATVNYTAVLGRGWKPLAPGNYILPDSKVNPCASLK